MRFAPFITIHMHFLSYFYICLTRSCGCSRADQLVFLSFCCFDLQSFADFFMNRSLIHEYLGMEASTAMRM